MITRKLSGWAAITLFGMFAASVQAEEPAIVRVTDQPVPAPTASVSTAPAPAGTIVNGSLVGGTVDGTCDGGCATGYDADGHRCCICSVLSYSPNRGFRRLDAAPVYREAPVYYHYWPAKWYGQPGFQLYPQFPMVYMPTDTTQLGFYYQRVPQWLPNPAMYPRPPRPSDWTRREILGGGVGGAGGACNMGGGMVIESGSSTPAISPTPATSAPSAPVAPPPPSPSVGVPPAGDAAPVAYQQPAPTQNQSNSSSSGQSHWLIDDIASALRR